MKGVIFTIVQEVVSELYDDDTWDDLLESAGVDGAFTSLADYPDTDLIAIVSAAVEFTGLPAERLLQEIGRRALPKLVERIPETIPMPSEPRSFIRGVNDVIDPEALKLYPSSLPPMFDVAGVDDGVVVHYDSMQNLPDLAHGLLSGVDDMFPESTTVERLTDDNDGRARFHVRISGP